VVVRNGERSIARAMNSLVAQRYPNLEVVVWDGLSEDSTLEVLKHYASIITTLKSEKDSGSPDGYNRAIALATGDYIGILNADDEYEPGTLWAVADKLREQPDADVVSFGMLFFITDQSGHKKVTGYYAAESQLALTLDRVLCDAPTFMSSRFYRRTLISQLGPINTDKSLWYYTNDREYMARLALQGCKNAIIPKALYGFESHAGGLSNNPDNFLGITEEHLRIANMLLTRGLGDHDRRCVKQWRKRQLAYGLYRALTAGKWQFAKIFFDQAMEGDGAGFLLFLPAVLVCKAVKRLSLKLSGAIDRGIL